MNIDVELIEKVVKKVLSNVEAGAGSDDYTYGIFESFASQKNFSIIL